MNVSDVTVNASDAGVRFTSEAVSAGVWAVVVPVGWAACVSGALGNVLVVSTLLLQPALRSLHNLYIGNLALADLLIAAYVMPFWLLDLTRGRHPVLNVAHCLTNSLITLLAFSVSVLTLVVIALNRYINVCHPALFATLFSRRRTVALCVLTWVLGLLLCAPSMLETFANASTGYDATMRLCFYRVTTPAGHLHGYSSWLTIGMLSLPSLIVGLSNLAIFRHWKTSRLRLAKWRRPPSSPPPPPHPATPEQAAAAEQGRRVSDEQGRHVRDSHVHDGQDTHVRGTHVHDGQDMHVRDGQDTPVRGTHVHDGQGTHVRDGQGTHVRGTHVHDGQKMHVRDGQGTHVYDGQDRHVCDTYDTRVRDGQDTHVCDTHAHDEQGTHVCDTHANDGQGTHVLDTHVHGSMPEPPQGSVGAARCQTHPRDVDEGMKALLTAKEGKGCNADRQSFEDRPKDGVCIDGSTSVLRHHHQAGVCSDQECLLSGNGKISSTGCSKSQRKGSSENGVMSSLDTHHETVSSLLTTQFAGRNEWNDLPIAVGTHHALKDRVAACVSNVCDNTPAKDSPTTTTKTAAASGNKGHCQRPRLSASDMSLIRSLLTVFVCCVLLYLPSCVAAIVNIYQPLSAEVAIWTVSCTFLNHCINWILYGLLNRHFREGYVRHLALCRRRRRPV